MQDNILVHNLTCLTHTSSLCVFALNFVCLPTLTSEPTKYYHILHRIDRGSWSTTEPSSHSHIQITNYVYKPSPDRHPGTWQVLYSLSPSFSTPWNHPIFLHLSTSPSLAPNMSLFLSLLSLQSDQELILWILTLIQRDSYNPLSDYGGTQTHVQTHTRGHIQHIRAPLWKYTMWNSACKYLMYIPSRLMSL